MSLLATLLTLVVGALSLSLFISFFTRPSFFQSRCLFLFGRDDEDTLRGIASLLFLYFLLCWSIFGGVLHLTITHARLGTRFCSLP